MADPNILMGIKTAQFMSPLDAAAQASQVKRSNLQNAMFQQEMDTQSKLDKAYQMSGGDVSKMQADPSIGYKAGMEINTLKAQQAQNAFKAQNEKLDYLLKESEYSAQQASGVKDQAGWDQVRNHVLQTLGPDAAAHMPEQFSEEAKQQLIDGAMSFKDRIAQQRADQQAMQQDRMYNATMERIAASERNAAQRGDGGSGEARYNTIYDTQGKAFFVNPKDPTAPPIPIKTETGEQIAKPPVSGGQPSEDERKAAGWVNQARLASKQMGEAMADDKSASSQGILEAVLPEGIARQTLTEQRQRFNDAASSFSEAALRAATGAGINESEAKQKIYELTPRYGDKPATVKDKLARQEMYLQSLESRAGRALPKQTEPTQLSNTNAKGWILHTDAQGNKAYVSPNGEIEEVR